MSAIRSLRRSISEHLYSERKNSNGIGKIKGRGGILTRKIQQPRFPKNKKSEVKQDDNKISG